MCKKGMLWGREPVREGREKFESVGGGKNMIEVHYVYCENRIMKSIKTVSRESLEGEKVVAEGIFMIKIYAMHMKISQ
jgi:hypothetical protein